MVAALFSSSKDPFPLFFKSKILEIHAESFSWNRARTGVSVVVAYLGGSTTTNYEGLMMRVTCNTKRVNTMVKRVWK